MKKKQFPFILILSVFLLIYFSCDKEVLELDNIEDGKTTDVLSFKKNGDVWKPRDTRILGEKLNYHINLKDTIPARKNFNINATRRIVDDSLKCIVCDWFSLRTNVIDTGIFSIIEGGISGMTNNICEYTQIEFMVLDSTFDNFVKVIEIDTIKNAAAGYFQFQTIDTICSDTVVITDGRFRLGFE